MRNLEKDEIEMKARREAMLNNGFRLFAEKGIEPVTMQEVANACGVGIATLYRYYNTKLALVIDIAVQKWAEFADYIRAEQKRLDTERIASSKSGNRTVFPMKWGFNIPIEHKTVPKLVVNERSETAAHKHSFANPWASHRCIVPASWYFEWEHYTNPAGRSCVGDKYSIQPRGTSASSFSGSFGIKQNINNSGARRKTPLRCL